MRSRVMAKMPTSIGAVGADEGSGGPTRPCPRGRDLLHRLELDDVGDFLGLAGGELAKQAAQWPGTLTASAS